MMRVGLTRAARVHGSRDASREAICDSDDSLPDMYLAGSTDSEIRTNST